MGYQKQLVIVLAACVTAGSSISTHHVFARPLHESVLANDAERVSLKVLLEKELHARRDEEFAFIGKVVSLVDNETLPRSLVESTLLWARKKSRHKFQYFEQAMKVRAKRIGVDL